MCQRLPNFREEKCILGVKKSVGTWFERIFAENWVQLSKLLLYLIYPIITIFYLVLSSKIGILSIKPWICFLEKRHSFFEKNKVKILEYYLLNLTHLERPSIILKPAVYGFQIIKRYNNRRKALNYNSGYLFKIHKSRVSRW